MGVVLDNVDFFIANVEAGGKIIILVFLGFIFSIQELQYENKVLEQFWSPTLDRDKIINSSAYW